jgi:hypothetical protein
MMMQMHVNACGVGTTALQTVLGDRGSETPHGNPLVEAFLCFVHLHLSLLTPAMCAQSRKQSGNTGRK